MKFTILTLFPEIIEGYFKSSIMAKAVRTVLSAAASKTGKRVVLEILD